MFIINFVYLNSTGQSMRNLCAVHVKGGTTGDTWTQLSVRTHGSTRRGHARPPPTDRQHEWKQLKERESDRQKERERGGAVLPPLVLNIVYLLSVYTLP